MERFGKISLIIFGVLSLFTIISHLIRYQGRVSLLYILIALVSNLFLLLAFALVAENLHLITKRKYIYLIFSLLLASFSLWYLYSTIMQTYYGEFLTLGGVFFSYTTTSFIVKAIFFIAVLASLFLLTFLIYHSSSNSGKFIKELKLAQILIYAMIIILIFAFIPATYLQNASPFTDYISPLFRNPTKDIPNQNYSYSQEKIINASINIKNPNIIFIMLEAVSASHIHYFGYERNITPNIDSLASKSISFDKAYSSASHSDYSQTAYLSSLYPLKYKNRDFFTKDYPKTFIWDILKKHGYNTAYISSQDDSWANIVDYLNTSNLDLYSYSMSDNSYDYGSGVGKKDYDENTTDKAISWISSSNKPFFLYLDLQATHYPYTYADNYSILLPDETNSSLTSALYIAEKDYIPSINRYDNALHYVDANLGRLLEYLNSSNLLNNTIIVLTADHGESFNNSHGFVRHGFSVYEDEVHIPLLFYIPNNKNASINERVKHLDVVPTLLSMLNFSTSEFFQGAEMRKDSPIFLTAQTNNFRIGMIRDNIKFIIDMESYNIEVYNLTLDPEENNNLAIDKNSKAYYTNLYGNELFGWYNCQIDYYKNKEWEKGNIIAC